MIHLQPCSYDEARHAILIVNDADIAVPPGYLRDVVAELEPAGTGLVTCLYRARSTTWPGRWEALGIATDFAPSALVAPFVGVSEFGLGSTLALRRADLDGIGGFEAVADYLADDYQLGNRIARRGYAIAISPVVVECWSAPMGWVAVWKHQLRWARTIRVCQPAPYFFSILGNTTLWPLLWLAVHPTELVLAATLGCWLVRVTTALHLQHCLTKTRAPLAWLWLVPLKDLLQAGLWLAAHLGSQIEWRGQRMRLRRDGTLVKC